MAISYFPFDSGSGANVFESQWREMARHWLGTGVLQGEDDELQVVESSPLTMAVQVLTGKAWIVGHFMSSDAAEQVVLSAADGSNPRIDRIVLRADFTANTISIEVLEGTPAASPAIPALTQSDAVWEISLGRVTVGTGVSSVSDADIADERTLVGVGTGSPTGSLTAYAGSAAPSGWAICDGSEVLRAGVESDGQDYSTLFGVIGTQYGAGDGSTTFLLPDMRGRMAVGVGTHADVDTLGDSDGLAASSRRPKHKHTVNDPTHAHSYTVRNEVSGAGSGSAGSSSSAATTGYSATGITIGPQTGAEPTDSPAYMALHYIIKL